MLIKIKLLLPNCDKWWQILRWHLWFKQLKLRGCWPSVFPEIQSFDTRENACMLHIYQFYTFCTVDLVTWVCLNSPKLPTDGSSSSWGLCWLSARLWMQFCLAVILPFLFCFCFFDKKSLLLFPKFLCFSLLCLFLYLCRCIQVSIQCGNEQVEFGIGDLPPAPIYWILCIEPTHRHAQSIGLLYLFMSTKLFIWYAY